MGIYIPNMEMPKSCEDCPLVEETENYFGDIMSRVCNLIYKGYTSEATKGRRRDDCPLVPLPEGHGRLIDGDALMMNIGDVPYKGSVRRVLLSAPTIIPAEGGCKDA